MRNIRLLVEYDGTDFAGFQKQADKRTVQGTLEEALNRLVGERVKVVGAGRTDAGVHALGQCANFRTRNPIPAERIAVALNRLLPRDVAVHKAVEAAPEFHARRSAKRRRYRYVVLNRPGASATVGRYCHIEQHPLDVAAMRRAARYLVGRHDFRSCRTGGEGSPVRNVRSITCRKTGRLVFITVEADAFVRQMVRIMVGLLLRVGRGEVSPSSARRVLSARDRSAAGLAAPPNGLWLVSVQY